MNQIKTKVKIFIFLFVLAQISYCQSKNQKNVLPAKKTNIVFIAIDDMNTWISAMGGQAKTPNIDKLASEGKLFANAHCVVPACNPSRVAILTGLRPETTGQFTNPGNFRDKPGNADLVTLPKYLKDLGYESIGIGKIFHKQAGKGEIADPQSDPQSWSFQYKNDIGTKGHQALLDENNQAKWLEGAMYKEGMDIEKPEYLTKFGVWGVTPEKKEETADWENAAYSAEYLSQAHEKPFFLSVGFMRPHSPQIAPQEFFDMYPLENVVIPELPEDDMDDIPQIAKRNFTSEFVEQVKAKNQIQKATQGYLASMSFVDACVGKVLEGIENGPNKDNTIIVLWSDHGWQLAHKNRWEKFSLWTQSTHAPLVIKYPNMKNRGITSNQAVSLLDLFPTVLDLSGIEKPDFLEGTSLKPLLEDTNYVREEPILITYEEGNISAHKNEWNLIQYVNGEEEFYNNLKDPHEFNNIINEAGNEEIKNELRASILELKK
ncbi:sulfatase [Lutibacter sp. HS1-25]|uniref:sulfatase n=1 Tax=Lutibacter sp. HS1-25 TaxID=2485000 RepID=UPI0013E8FE3B|nr:sulfatase [Lutibacter sp. HS1-25]